MLAAPSLLLFLILVGTNADAIAENLIKDILMRFNAAMRPQCGIAPKAGFTASDEMETGFDMKAQPGAWPGK